MTFPDSWKDDVVKSSVGVENSSPAALAAPPSRCLCSSPDTRSNTAARAAGPRLMTLPAANCSKTRLASMTRVGLLKRNRHNERASLRG